MRPGRREELVPAPPAVAPRRGVTRALSVAPMMERTDRHFRVVCRQFSRETLLYTEMVHTGAILHGDRERHLAYSPVERPLALQLGGDDPRDLAACARIAAEYGYDEVNLNVGCPSDRVQSGRFGACLMARPGRVAEAVAEMRAAVDLPVTVKHRIGIDDLDRYEDMLRFVDVVARAGCDRFTVHARKAWLSGLSPKENREVPPLRYGDVHRLKRERPDLVIEINGGIINLDQAAAQLAEGVDAVMMGRAIYDRPALLADADQRLFGVDRPATDPEDAVVALIPYVDDWIRRGGRLHHVTRHLHALFTGRPGARAWRQHLATRAALPGAGVEVLLEGVEHRRRCGRRAE